MIQGLDIQGFQAHQDLSIEFDPGVTTIIGPSDAGKSSIIRALRWVLLNEPSGDAFVNWDLGECKVSLKIDDESVTRTRTQSENSYDLNVKEFRAFGQSVPDEISALLRVDDVNFQGQYDSPFWLDESSGEVSRHLNRIVGLSIIDRVFSRLTSMIRERVVRVEVIKELKGSAKIDYKRWSSAPHIDRDLKSLEYLEDERGGVVEKVSLVADLIGEYESRYRDKVESDSRIGDLLELVTMADKVYDLQIEIEALECVISEFELNSPLAEVEVPDSDAVDYLMTDLEIRDQLTRLISGAVSTSAAVIDACNVLEGMEEAWKREMGEVCALCGQKIER